MTLQPYSIALIFTSAFLILIILLLWQRRRAPGGMPLVLFLVSVAWWAGAAAFEFSSSDVQLDVFWSSVSYIGSTVSPVFFLLFALEYVRQDHWLAHRWRWALFIVPVITILMAFTNSSHYLLWTSFTPAAHNSVIYGHGPWFWVYVAYTYAVLSAAVLALLVAAFRYPEIYRRQVGVLLLGSLFPVISNVLYVFEVIPSSGLDLTPLAFSLTGLTLAWNVSRYQLLDLVPVARYALIDQMKDGVLLVDSEGRLADLNPAMRDWLRLESGWAGRPAVEILASWPEIIPYLNAASDLIAEVEGREGLPAWLELHLTLLRSRGVLNGRMLVLRDISIRKRSEVDLQHANQRLREQLVKIETLQTELHQQFERDQLTGLYNRRYVGEWLPVELVHRLAENRPLSVVLIDVDFLNQINDLYGHEAGDLLLRELGTVLQRSIRPGDVACRLGGDEFLLILPGADLQAACLEAERLRSLVEDLRVPYESALMHVTVSAGVASAPVHGRTELALLRAADRAMSAVKAAGRNQVLAAEISPS